LRERVLIYDGATGTNFQLQDLHADDFGGAALEGCNEILVVTKPGAVEQLHRSFLDVGVDVIETDSFGAFSVVLVEYGIADRAQELAMVSAQIARRVADSYASPGSPRFVAGSMGPGTKFPSLGQITYDDLSASYEEMALGLLEGGVDLLIVETIYDLLSGKAAIAACHRAMVRHGRVVPIQAQVTIELTGRMLPGTEIGAAITALSPLGVDVLGLNCATGPVEMYEPLRNLRESSLLPLSCLPNAGLPSVVDGKMHYDLTPDALAEHLSKFVTEYGVQVVGGCCGTTPRHMARVIETVRPLTPAVRTPSLEPAVASIYSATNYQQDRSVLLVGERTNANGSKKFRDAMLEGDWDTCVGIGRDQIKEGAHILDVCVDYTGADGVADMNELMSRLATQSSVPIMVDTTVRPSRGWAARHCSTRSISKRATVRAPGSTGSSRSPRSSGRRSSPRALTKRARPARPTGRCAPRAPSPISRSRVTDSTPRTSSSTRWRCRSRRGWSSHAVTASRRSRPFDESRPSYRACERSSDCPTSPSGSTRARARCSTASSCTSVRRPGSTPPSCTPRSCCPSIESTKRLGGSASISSTTAAATTTTR
jgi:5-methyltetrahydrofolate--homocysteine methyltransferase